MASAVYPRPRERRFRKMVVTDLMPYRFPVIMVAHSALHAQARNDTLARRCLAFCELHLHSSLSPSISPVNRVFNYVRRCEVAHQAPTGMWPLLQPLFCELQRAIRNNLAPFFQHGLDQRGRQDG